MWDLSSPTGDEPKSPALQEGFFFCKTDSFFFFNRSEPLRHFIYLFIHSFLAALGLRCCAWAFSSCGEWGLLLVAVRRLLTAVASLVVEHRL